MSAAAFVYAVPARYEDILKLGFSHEPTSRVRSFHARWYEYFEIERGFVLAATDEKDARRIERELGAVLREHRARAPLVINEAAGGYTEWYRGAYDALAAAAAALAQAGGYAPLQALDARLRECLIEERQTWFERSNAMLDAIDALAGSSEAIAIARKLRDALDAYDALGIVLDAHLPDAVRDWWRG
jgi:hypothetical protein